MVFRRFLEQQFANQFEEDEFGPVYRKDMMAPPVRVTAEERDAFIHAYGRRAVPIMWWFVVALQVFMVAAIALAFTYETATPELWIIPGLGLLIGGFAIGLRRHWTAPTEHLRERAPVGPARSRAEVRRRNLSKMSWGYVAIICVPLLLVLVTNLAQDPAETGQRRWLTILIAGLALTLWGGIAVVKQRMRD